MGIAGIFNQFIKGISQDSGLVQTNNAGFKQLPQTDANGNFATPVPQYDNFNRQYLDIALAQQPWLNTAKKDSTGSRIPDLIAAKDLPKINQGGNPYGIPRKPWIFATFEDVVTKSTTDSTDPLAQLQTLNSATNSPNTIVWFANPRSVDWLINQRGSEAKTKSGTVLHIWRDRFRKTDYDDPKITMTFQSGSIHPGSGYSNATDINALTQKPEHMPPGLNDFYKFLQLVDSSKIVNGQANLIHILYRSAIFPSMMITGFFDPQSVVRFSDNADNPWQVNNWSATFTVYKTVPDFKNWNQLKQMFAAEYSGSPTDQILNGPGVGPQSASQSQF